MMKKGNFDHISVKSIGGIGHQILISMSGAVDKYRFFCVAWDWYEAPPVSKYFPKAVELLLI